MRISTWFRPLIVRLSRPRPRRLSQRPAYRPCLEALEDRLTPSGGGVLDPTFGSGGAVLSSTGTGSQALTDVTILSDGRLLAAGDMTGTSGTVDFAAARYNANGSLDTSFGSGGVSLINFGGVAMGIAVQPNSGGKMLLAGGAFQVVRLNPDGTLDTTFGPKGSKGLVSVTPVPRVGNRADSMAVLSDGRFILAGLAKNVGSSSAGSLVLARFNANGTLDTTFGNKGTVVTSITIQDVINSEQHTARVAVDASGRIVVTASTAGTSRDFLVARFNANGSLDTTFGPAHTGVVTTDILSGSNDNARALAIQADGKIVVGGGADPINGNGYVLALARYNPDGSLDTTFDGDGIATAAPVTNFTSGAEIYALAVQSDGRIATAGTGDYVTTPDDGYQGRNLVVAMRFNADGSTDTSYGPSGTGAVLTSPGENSFVMGAALQPDGRMVVAGKITTTNPSYVENFALTRFLGTAPSPSPSPVQVGSLTATPNPVAAGSPITLTADGVTTTNAGATITSVAFYAVNDAGVEIFLGYAIRNADGSWSLTFTGSLASGQYTLLALAVDSTGAISDPLASNLDVQ